MTVYNDTERERAERLYEEWLRTITPAVIGEAWAAKVARKLHGLESINHSLAEMWAVEKQLSPLLTAACEALACDEDLALLGEGLGVAKSYADWTREQEMEGAA